MSATTLPSPADAPEQADSTLARAAALRFPNLSELHGSERVEALTDHIVETANVRGELEELRLEANVELLRISQQFARMPTAGRNRAATDEAKRAAAPELAAEQEHSRWIVARCTEQINRLGGSDYDAASRAYTLLTGS